MMNQDPIDDLLGEVTGAPPRPPARTRRPLVTTVRPRKSRTPAPPAPPSLHAGWSAVDDVELQDFLNAGNFPVSAKGQSATHNRLGFDHRSNLDVGVNPSTPEGVRLVNYLRERGVPFQAFSRAIPGAATGPHVHIGSPSRRTGAHYEVGTARAATGTATETDDVDSLLDEVAGGSRRPAAFDDIDSLLNELTGSDDDDVVRTQTVINRAGERLDPRTHQTLPTERAQNAGALPPLRTVDIHTPEGRAERDGARALENGRDALGAVDVQLPSGQSDWSQVSSRALVHQAMRQLAGERQIPAEFVEQWLQQHGANTHLRDASGNAVNPVDVIGTEHYDGERRTIRVGAELPAFKRMEAEYLASRGTARRVTDWATDDARTAGEKFMDVAEPTVEGAAHALDIATRPMQAASTGFWATARGKSPDEIAHAMKEEFLTGRTVEGAENWIAEQLRHSDRLKAVNPNLPGMLGELANMVADPVNLLPVMPLTRLGARALRATRTGARVMEGLEGARDSLAASRLGSDGNILRIADAPLDMAARAAEEQTALNGLLFRGAPHAERRRQALKHMMDSGMSYPEASMAAEHAARTGVMPQLPQPATHANARQPDGGTTTVNRLAPDAADAPEPSVSPTRRSSQTPSSPQHGATSRVVEEQAQSSSVSREPLQPAPVPRPQQGAGVEGTAPLAESRGQWQHRDFGLITEVENQYGAPARAVRVVDEAGTLHTINRPDGSGKGNQLAVPVRSERANALVDGGGVRAVEYGSANRLVTKARADEARARLKARLSTNRMNDITELGGALGDVLELSTFHVEAGARTFADFSARMIADVGDEIKPHLKELYANSQARLREESGVDVPVPQLATAPPPPARTPLPTVISSMRKAGLLTGIKTHARNIGGNFAFQIAEEAARIPSAIADLVVSAATRQRTTTGASPRAAIRSSREAATKGVREAWKTLRSGVTPEEMRHLQIDGEMNSGSRILDTYVNGTFRLLSAEDRVFRSFAARRSLEDQARVLAINERRRGRLKRGEVRAHAKALAQQPTEAMSAQAVADAEFATFNNNNFVTTNLTGAVRDKLRNAGTRGRWANAGIDLVLPFDRTPTNIIARILEYSGGVPASVASLGYKAAAAKIAGRAFTAADQRAFARTFGRGATGAAAITLGYTLARSDLLTGLYDDNTDAHGRNNVQRAAGRPPMAIRVGDTWHQIGGFSPLGNLLAIGATIYRERHQPLKDEEDRPARLAGIASDVVMEQPLLGAMRDLTGGGQTSDKGGRLVGSFVPQIVADAGTLLDGHAREARGFTGQIKNRVPGLRERLPEAMDVFGRPLPERRTAAIDPTLSTTARDGAVERELLRLNVGIGTMKKQPDESAAQFRARRLRDGAELYSTLSEIVTSEDYRQMSEAEQRKMLGKEIRRPRAQMTREREREEQQ